MEREITEHTINPENDKIKINVLDEPDQAGAYHAYLIEGFDCSKNPSSYLFNDVDAERMDERRSLAIAFQNGPIKEVGVNGVTHEALLSIVIHRLSCYQNGKFACHENTLAIAHLKEALSFLHRRTRDRDARGVEGTMQQ